MITVGVHEAKTSLSKLIKRVLSGEDVVITRSGVPVARITAVQQHRRRAFGQDRGLFHVPDDFDAPLPDDVLASFES